MGLHKKILIGLHRKHRSLHLCVVQVGVHREKTGYTAMEKEVVRPATFANVRVCKITILLSYSARCGCITVAHAQIEHTTRSMVLCHISSQLSCVMLPGSAMLHCEAQSAAFRIRMIKPLVASCLLSMMLSPG